MSDICEKSLQIKSPIHNNKQNKGLLSIVLAVKNVYIHIQKYLFECFSRTTK